MKTFIKVREYFRANLAASFVTFFIVSMFVILLAFQGFIQTQYMSFMLEQTTAAWENVMSAELLNFNNRMRTLIIDGSKLATWADIRLLANDYAASANDENKRIAAHNLYRKLSYQSYTSPGAIVALIDSNGLITQYDPLRSNSYNRMPFWLANDNDFELTKIYHSILYNLAENNLPRYLAFTTPSDYDMGKTDRLFHVAYPLTGGMPALKRTNVVLVLSYDLNFLGTGVGFLDDTNSDYLEGYLTDNDGVIVYHTDPSYIGASEKMLIRDREVTRISKMTDYFGWSINVLVDEAVMMALVKQLYRQGVIMYLVLITAYSTLSALVLRRMIRPIHEISEAMRMTEGNGEPVAIPVRGENEIWRMIGQYNRMSAAVNDRNRLIAEQHAKSLAAMERCHAAEQDALTSQINAHFICNTLAVINYEAIEAGNNQVSVLIKKLSGILRYSFDQTSPTVYLFQELEWLDQYFFLQSARFEGVFKYEIHVPDEYMSLSCLKLMFHPFVENAIIHGFEGISTGGLISVTAEPYNGKLKISIHDNGRGIPENKRDHIRAILAGNTFTPLQSEDARIGTGIRNSVERMRMFYGEKIHMDMQTNDDGVAFEFILPFQSESGG
jgi:sensor histidine kinase YesM